MKLKSFMKGDIVVSIGKTFKFGSDAELNYCVSEVLLEGYQHLVLKSLSDSNSFYGQKCFVYPKIQCVKIKVPDSFKNLSLDFPEVGDLVGTVIDPYKNEKIECGILQQIIDKPNIKKKAIIKLGNDEKLVYYENLFIVERNNSWGYN